MVDYTPTNPTRRTHHSTHIDRNHHEPVVASPGIIVPQEVSNPTRHTHHELPTLVFSHGNLPGINLQAAIRGTHAGSLDHNDRPITTTVETANSINIRILWPGYAEYSTNIIVKEPGSYQTGGINVPYPIWRIAMSVAKVVQEFYSRAVPVVPREHCDRALAAPWNIRNIPFDCLRLFELRQVSLGVWQPVLVYDPARRDATTSTSVPVRDPSHTTVSSTTLHLPPISPVSPGITHEYPASSGYLDFQRY
ncbi:hypothetical protein BDY19DRAFT_929458 [Irpex rosettiformis]|uniref:Uncharacterized protein n=1 Tax=Irpex rosettiformis TaxID=378272 RepID=A0ACB8UDS1_9APHY|nr:hypothetical protein BDY19DRAFT_929458 [Irpex rosettiformis]